MNKTLIVTAAVAALALCGGAAWYFLGGDSAGLPPDVKVFVDGKEVSPGQVKSMTLPGGGMWEAKSGSLPVNAPMKEMVDGYFKLPDGPQRTAYLDKLIDSQEAVRKDMKVTTGADGKTQVSLQAPPTTGPGGGVPGERRVIVRAGPGAADSIPPETSAKMAELVSAINKRRAERGLPPAQGLMLIKREPG